MMHWIRLYVRTRNIWSIAYQFIIDSISDGVLILNAQNRILALNRVAQNLFDRPVLEVIGYPLQHVWPDCPDAICLANHHQADLSLEMILGKGEAQRVYDVRISTLFNQFIYFKLFPTRVVVLCDVTIHKRTEAALHAVTIENTQLCEQLQQELAACKLAEEKLCQYEEDLENQVVIRTAKLSQENKTLTQALNEHKHIEDELLQRNRELLSLQAAATATSSSLDIPFILETVTWEMINLLRVEDCAITEWNQEADTISVIAEYGSTSWWEQGAVVEVYDLADYPLRKQVLVEQYTQQRTIGQSNLTLAELTFLQQANLKTLLLIPMIFQDRAVGLVEMKDSQVERTFTDREISLLQLLANQAAGAIANARLYEQAQKEISERIQAEETIKASLKEKEVLLKEIHHRVKNNLQVISSLLNLQSQFIENQATLEVFKESQHRIRSMALIHEELYRSHDLARIDFAEYIHNLTAYLIHSYRPDLGAIALKINASDVFLSIETAVPCGLLINELISNALKHAFPPNNIVSNNHLADTKNEIYINLSLNLAQQVTLIVGDNGVGFPIGIDFQDTESLGMQLVNTLTDQLDGTVVLNNEDGAEFKITFPAS